MSRDLRRFKAATFSPFCFVERTFKGGYSLVLFYLIFPKMSSEFWVKKVYLFMQDKQICQMRFVKNDIDKKIDNSI